MNDYKEKLIALLEGLECKEIDELIERTPDFLKEFGFAMTSLIKMAMEKDNITDE